MKSVEALKSTRPVRALLLKGADREAVDNDGRRAAEVIGAGVNENMRQDLEMMLVS